jgi:hypothetical protein
MNTTLYIIDFTERGQDKQDCVYGVTKTHALKEFRKKHRRVQVNNISILPRDMRVWLAN